MEKQKTTSLFSNTGYILSMMGSAIGFANILSFSARCYKNGGGAFLIPYVVAMLIIGLPMLFLEGIIGQSTLLPLVPACRRAAGSKAAFFAWIAVIACASIGAFYSVLTGWSVAYTTYAAMGSIPQDCASFFLNTFLQDSGSIEQFGKFSWSIFLSTLAVSVFTWFILVRDIKDGIESACSLFMPLLALLIGIFSLFVCFLPGAFDGLAHFFSPDFSKIWSPTLWREVFGHVFFSFSLGLGIVVGYSRYTSTSMSIPKAMAIVAGGDFFISFLSGLTIFACVGFMSHSTAIPFEEIVQSDSTFEMGFVIFPLILQCFPPIVSSVIGSLFFFCVFIAGITGFFSIVESVSGNIEIELQKSRKEAVTLSILGIGAFSLFFCMGNAIHILSALEPMVLGHNMLLGGLAEVFVFMYCAKNIRDHHIWFTNERRNFSYYIIRYAVPFFLLSILSTALVAEFSKGIFDTSLCIRWLWFATACVLSLLLTKMHSRQKQSTPDSVLHKPEMEKAG